MKPVVVIIGAGPAGLTAALELIRDGRAHPIVLEASDAVGGISRTIEKNMNTRIRGSDTRVFLHFL